MSEAGGVPALRFPEFSGEWVTKRLAETARFLKGKSISKADIVNANGTPCIRYGELYTIYSEVISKIESQTNLPIRELIFSEANDVIIPASGETALDIATASCVEQSGVALGGDLNIIRSSLTGHFLAYYLSHRKKKDIARLAQGNSVVHLYKDQLSSLKIGTPTFLEQQKIADFLGAVDTRVGLLRRRRDALRTYKKGMMQRLFAQDLRFTKSDGSPFPDWQEKRLGEVARKTSSSLAANMLPDFAGHYPVFGANGFLGNLDTFQNEEPYIAIVKDGAGVGRVFMCPKKSSVLGTLDQIHQRDANDIKFIYYFLSHFDFLKYVAGSTIPHIYFRDYGQARLRVPHPEEQQKIAETLTALDAKIDAVTSQVDAMLRFKKGLLQKMFV